MNIAFLNTLYHPYRVGGAERSVQLIVEGVAERITKAVVITLSPPNSKPSTDHIAGISVSRVPLKNIYWPYDGGQHQWNLHQRVMWHLRNRYNADMAQSVCNILQQEDIHLLHSHNISGFTVSAWKAARDAGIPIVHTVRDYSLLCPRVSMYKRGNNCNTQCCICKYFSAPKFKLSNLVNAVIGVSEYTLGKHVKAGYFPNASRHVIYNPAPSPIPKTEIRSQAESSMLRLGYLGRIAPNKGIEDLVQSVVELSSQVSLHLYIAGKGTEAYESYIQRLASNGPITLIGFANPEELFDIIDILVVPSLWHEPFPRAVLEAFAFGVPVIGSNRGGIPEIIDEDFDGWLYEPDEPSALDDAILHAARNKPLLRSMALTALDKAKAYSARQCITKHEALYHKLVGMS